MSNLHPTVEYHRLLTTFAEAHVSPRVFAGLANGLSRSDVVSAAWINAFRYHDRIAELPEHARPAYLFRIFSNKLNDVIGTAPKEVPVSSLVADLTESGVRLAWWEPVDSTAGPAETDREAEQERRARVLAAVAELPDRDRQVVILQHYHGWTFQQIADHTGETRGAVSGLHRRALDRLRTVLGDMAGDLS